MKKFLSLALLISMFGFAGGATAFTNTYDQANNECGQWEDVSSTYRDMYTTICNAGFMQGTETDTFSDDRELSRAEAAVIANRIVMGTDDYEDIDNSGSYYKSRLDLIFTDTPPNEWWNEWILKAMYHVDDNGIMTGDGNSQPTTFRATETISTAEFLKVIYESAKESGLLEDDYDKNISYSGGTWYASLVQHYNDMGFLDNYDVYSSKFIDFDLHYDTDDSSKHHNYDLDLEEDLTRQDAAAIIYEMLYLDIMDAAGTVVTSEDLPDLVVTDLDHSPSSADASDAISFTGVVENQGGADADSSVLYYYVGGSTDPYEVNIPALGSNGGAYTFSVELDAGDLSAQNYQNSIYVDAEDDVEESSESNNDETYHFTVGGSGIDLELSDIYHGSSWGDFYVEVTNTGDEEIDYTGDMHLQLFVNDNDPMLAIMFADLAEEDDDFLSPGGISVFGPYDFEFMEDHVTGALENVVASIDEDDYLDEDDESNNTMTLNL